MAYAESADFGLHAIPLWAIRAGSGFTGENNSGEWVVVVPCSCSFDKREHLFVF